MMLSFLFVRLKSTSLCLPPPISNQNSRPSGDSVLGFKAMQGLRARQKVHPQRRDPGQTLQSPPHVARP